VLALSRMVAVPAEQRRLKHISKALKRQMRLIDRSRWPVLVTYSDESVGHTGHVYKCSGWTPTTRKRVRTYAVDGVRTSSYQNGVSRPPEGAEGSFERHSTNQRYLVGWWMNWRLERARLHHVRGSYWSEIPAARLLK
jgi:hypothetical protein